VLCCYFVFVALIGWFPYGFGLLLTTFTICLGFAVALRGCLLWVARSCCLWVRLAARALGFSYLAAWCGL